MENLDAYIKQEHTKLADEEVQRQQKLTDLETCKKAIQQFIDAVTDAKISPLQYWVKGKNYPKQIEDIQFGGYGWIVRDAEIDRSGQGLPVLSSGWLATTELKIIEFTYHGGGFWHPTEDIIKEAREKNYVYQCTSNGVPEIIFPSTTGWDSVNMVLSALARRLVEFGLR